ncbi:hypothetical protein Vadar_032552 [Vaccinium darrowii]|uniref:Uncharacterized protein n=1 Tax=Vaccinium darrowii TaxID=229202 RepID=A0ACB7XVE2_9ERIC|nr:hypothetical protein Vadar_032552 [Vaccinium darrowii]
MYESGVDNWTVRCRCGARDDDSEKMRMVACDISEIWQHTRCCGIEDSDVFPPLFLCAGCCASLVPSTAQSSYEFEGFGMQCYTDSGFNSIKFVVTAVFLGGKN